MQLSDSDIKALKGGPWSEFTSKQVGHAKKLVAQYGLNPLKNEIYLIVRKQQGKQRVMAQVGIDGYRIIAGRHPDYEGQTPVQWCGPDGKWMDVWLDKTTPPAAARVGVYRKGAREATYAVLTWDEYKDNAGRIAKTMKAHMLAKAAESLALRKAFPDSFAGLYTDEELDTGGQQPLSPAKIELLMRLAALTGMDEEKLAGIRTWAESQKEKVAFKAFSQMIGRVCDARDEDPPDGLLDSIEEALSGKDEKMLEGIIDDYAGAREG